MRRGMNPVSFVLFLGTLSPAAVGFSATLHVIFKPFSTFFVLGFPKQAQHRAVMGCQGTCAVILIGAGEGGGI